MIVRLISGFAFAGAFIWVAVRFFGVDLDEVIAFGKTSVVFVIGLMVLAFVASFLLRWLRRGTRGNMLDHLDDMSDEEDKPGPKGE